MLAVVYFTVTTFHTQNLIAWNDQIERGVWRLEHPQYVSNNVQTKFGTAVYKVM